MENIALDLRSLRFRELEKADLERTVLNSRSGFGVVYLEDEARENAAYYADGLVELESKSEMDASIDAAGVAEAFTDVVYTSYVDSDALTFLNELMSLETVEERAAFVRESKDLYSMQNMHEKLNDVIFGLGPKDGSRLLNELETYAPEYNWSEKGLEVAKRRSA